MPNRHTVKIALRGKRGTIEVDGHDISHSVTGFTIDSYALDGTTVTLHLPVDVADVEAANIRIPVIAHDALVTLGWTPPPA